MNGRRGNIEVKTGDITSTYLPAIVNAGNTSLWLGTGVAGAIKQNAGPTIQEELDWIRTFNDGNYKLGDVVVTHGGSLTHIQYILHAAVMHSQGPEKAKTDENIIYAATRNSILTAKNLGVWGVAMPLFGTGVGGMDHKVSAATMIRAINRYSTYDLTVMLYCFGEGVEDIVKEVFKHV